MNEGSAIEGEDLRWPDETGGVWADCDRSEIETLLRYFRDFVNQSLDAKECNCGEFWGSVSSVQFVEIVGGREGSLDLTQVISAQIHGP